MRAAQNINLVVRFALELAALAALAYWGSQTGTGVVRLVLALTAPAALALVWGTFLAPRRRIDLPKPVRLVLELAVFGAAALALVATGHDALAIALAAIALVSGLLNYVWGESEPGSFVPKGG
jgi:hypothetical protein